MEAKDRIIAALSGEESALRRAGTEMVVDHVLGLALGDLVDTASLLPVVVDALTAANVERVIERHVVPGITRVRVRLADAKETVGDHVPEDVRTRIAAMASQPDGPRFLWLEGALDPAKLRDLIAPVIQETLVQFAKRVSGAGASGGGARREGGGGGPRGAGGAGLAWRLGREVSKKTGRLVDVGRSMAEGLGVDLEARFQEAARDFSRGAVRGVQRAMRDRVESAEGQRIMAELSRGVVDHIMATPIEKILRDLDRLPLEDAVRLAPEIIAHDVARELIRAAIAGEIDAFLQEEGRRSLRELLEEAGLLDAVRSVAIERGHAVSRALIESPTFADWLDRVLADDD